MQDSQGTNEIDPIWTSSRTARQIYALGEVERVSWFTMLWMVSEFCETDFLFGVIWVGYQSFTIVGFVFDISIDVAANGWSWWWFTSRWRAVWAIRCWSWRVLWAVGRKPFPPLLLHLPRDLLLRTLTTLLMKISFDLISWFQRRFTSLYGRPWLIFDSLVLHLLRSMRHPLVSFHPHSALVFLQTLQAHKQLPMNPEVYKRNVSNEMLGRAFWALSLAWKKPETTNYPKQTNRVATFLRPISLPSIALLWQNHNIVQGARSSWKVLKVQLSSSPSATRY